ncbi:hypothetical protein [Bacillus xiapuensis]|uniref:hypothetical protein n=1 Tax=Bacillus xiapuensis TaxID=2014075 RepID=UPI0012FD6B1E|nr:hypothetical protein [Bacillus xiapuensis]
MNIPVVVKIKLSLIFSLHPPERIEAAMICLIGGRLDETGEKENDSLDAGGRDGLKFGSDDS